jgi:hypothetical protein
MRKVAAQQYWNKNWLDRDHVRNVAAQQKMRIG